ncbi:patatin-like phospholipase family protein [Acinetobacter rudis]|uniref:Patatin-like phospholipase family protein n=1 Tax=Acinetobacter rudis TaxID=632955 RepID=A0AAW8JAS0_9GAMM|nr:patatin-like phospholipase family protein [Acinetobacter rudis]MDQ8936251.1 patatin-like phospholipase family protein [Acinetobacter rudis]MDQ9018514.1 patatin-like phospholipase family protein [Acinetobacter rudis]
MQKPLKTGLVLSGGGAKGAYHVGVVKALAEYGIEADAIAGASIGALNGSLLATSQSMQQGYQRLNKVWQQLSQQSPLKLQSKNVFIPSYMVLLASFGLRFNTPNMVRYIAYRSGKELLQRFNIYPEYLKSLEEKLTGPESVLDNTPLTSLIDEYLQWDDLKRGIPLYVSAYKSDGGLLDLMGCIAAMLDIKDTAPSEFFCLQQLSEQNWKNALMASAALPLLYESQKIDGQAYTDGGQGGWKTVQGNTPITPLINAGCNLVIVSHLSDGSLWDRHRFPDTTVIEIRPQKEINRDGMRDLLAFKPSRIGEWIEQGYTDTVACIGKIKGALESRGHLATVIQAQQKTEQEMLGSSDRMQDMMARLRSK